MARGHVVEQVVDGALRQVVVGGDPPCLPGGAVGEGVGGHPCAGAELGQVEPRPQSMGLPAFGRVPDIDARALPDGLAHQVDECLRESADPAQKVRKAGDARRVRHGALRRK